MLTHFYVASFQGPDFSLIQTLYLLPALCGDLYKAAVATSVTFLCLSFFVILTCINRPPLNVTTMKLNVNNEMTEWDVSNNGEAFSSRNTEKNNFLSPQREWNPWPSRIPVGRSNDWALRDSWWARSYTRFLYVWHVSFPYCKPQHFARPYCKAQYFVVNCKS